MNFKCWILPKSMKNKRKQTPKLKKSRGEKERGNLQGRKTTSFQTQIILEGQIQARRPRCDVMFPRGHIRDRAMLLVSWVPAQDPVLMGAVLLGHASLRMLDRMCPAAAPKQVLPLSFWRRLGADEAGAVFSSPVTDLRSTISLLCLVVFLLSKERCCKTV